MDVLLLSRLQFAAATMFHFLFVPLTLGLSVLIAIMETLYVKTGDEDYIRMAKFWGKLFLINFAVGVVTGITLEFQFGTNWSRYSAYVGDIFGSLLAIEATVAFFLEIPRVFAYGILLAASPLVGEALFLRGYASHHGFPVVFGVSAVAILVSGIVRFVRFLPPPQRGMGGPTAEGNRE